MPDVGGFLETVADYALTWLPLVFFGLIIYLLWRTLQYMPRVKPAKLERELGSLRHVGRRRRRRGGEGGAAGGRRLPPRSEALRAPRRARPEGDPALRPARHRQDAAREGGRQRVGREVLLAERLGVRRDVRRPRRRADPQALRGGAQERAGDRLHRRARRRRHARSGGGFNREQDQTLNQLLVELDGFDERDAGRRDGRVEPAPGSRPGAAPPRPLRPPDARLAARPERPRGDPARAHARQAARRGRRLSARSRGRPPA